MQYLKISNKGELDLTLLQLVGASTKSDQPEKIGQFGTGLKYAIAYFMRNNIGFRMFIGDREIIFDVRRVPTKGGKTFDVIHYDGTSTNVTTEYGYQWSAWEAIREIWCNAKDEGGEQKKVTTCASIISGKQGRTTIFVEMSSEISEVVDSWGEYFIIKKPIFDRGDLKIYRNEPDAPLRLYKKGVLIKTLDAKSLFSYEYEGSELNELRQYMGSVSNVIFSCLLNSTSEIISQVLSAIKSNLQVYETKLDWSWAGLISRKYLNKDHIKQIFSGWLFLKSQNGASGKRAVFVSESMFNFLSAYGLPCESVSSSYGGYFGSSGIKSDHTIEHKPVNMPDLSERIERITANTGHGLRFVISVPFKEDFELIIEDGKAVFNASVADMNDSDLTTVVLTAIIMSSGQNLYTVLKRILKACRGNKNLYKMLFTASELSFGSKNSDYLPF